MSRKLIRGFEFNYESKQHKVSIIINYWGKNEWREIRSYRIST